MSTEKIEIPNSCKNDVNNFKRNSLQFIEKLMSTFPQITEYDKKKFDNYKKR